MSPDEEIRRANEAQQLLNNSYLKAAFEAVEKSVLDQMDEVSLRDVDMHTRLIIARKTIHAVKRFLERHIETGELAKLQIEKRGVVSRFINK